MEKDIGKIKKNDATDILIRVDDYGGKVGITIREYAKTEKYTGFTKSGTRIPAEHFLEFREMINSIPLDDLKASNSNKQESSDKQEEVKEEDLM